MMATLIPASRFRNPMLFGLVVAVLAAVILSVWFSFGQDRSAYKNSVSVEQPLPPRPDTATSTADSSSRSIDPEDQRIDGELANPSFTNPTADETKPAAPDLSLVDASRFGPLPRIAADGRLPLSIYGRPFDRSDERPKIAIMVTGLGPQGDATSATFHLPGAISLSFSPYTEDLPSLFERARLAGHEVLLELPMEPTDYPTNDPGPHTLRASGTVDANIERLTWVLSRAPGYFAVTGRGGAFATSTEAVPVVEAIASKGIGMIEIDGDALSEKARDAGLAYTTAPIWIDETPAVGVIDKALADLEAKAKAEGMALGVAEAYPITLQRLVEWSATLDQRGIALVPVSAVLFERSGLLPDNDQASNVAQTRN